MSVVEMKKNFKEKISDFFFLDDEDLELDPQEEERIQTNNETAAPIMNTVQRPSKRNVVSMNQKRVASNSRISIVEPRFETDAENIADMLLNGESVVLNVRRMEQAQAVKMINFLQGAIYAISGDMERVGEEIFICAPETVNLVLSELEVSERDFFNTEN